MDNKKTKLIVILGPTAVGKSDLAVQIAQWIAKEKIGGFVGAEIISADSRQVYKGLDIGTGKITKEEMCGVTHHLLDIIDPNERLTAIDWKRQAEKVISEITTREKLPIICGGTGFYISTLIDDLGFPDVPADTNEQKELESKSVDELFKELKKVDPARSFTIDPKNKRRLSRAIIIARKLGAVPPITQSNESKYDLCMIGISLPGEQLKQRIGARLIKRLDSGMIEEAEKLHNQVNPLSFERMEELGLEYRYLSYYLRNHASKDRYPISTNNEEIQLISTKEKLIEVLSAKIWQYAKRQMTWFKKDRRIHWFLPSELDKIKTFIENILVK